MSETGVFWLIRKLYFQAKFLLVRDMKVYRRSGYQLLLDARSGVDRSIIRKGTWERAQVDYLFETARTLFGDDRDRNVFLDVGSYIGWYSFKALQTRCFGQIMAFDADPLNFAQLNLNVQLNDAGKIIATRNIAVSDSAGTVTFRSSTNDPKNRGLAGGPLSTDHKTVEVRCAPLDDAVRLEGRNLVIKIDVEGNEMSVVRGMSGLLSSNRALLQVELFHGKQQELLDEMSGQGYRLIHAIERDHYFTNVPEGG